MSYREFDGQAGPLNGAEVGWFLTHVMVGHAGAQLKQNMKHQVLVSRPMLHEKKYVSECAGIRPYITQCVCTPVQAAKLVGLDAPAPDLFVRGIHR